MWVSFHWEWRMKHKGHCETSLELILSCGWKKKRPIQSKSIQAYRKIAYRLDLHGIKTWKLDKSVCCEAKSKRLCSASRKILCWVWAHLMPWHSVSFSKQSCDKTVKSGFDNSKSLYTILNSQNSIYGSPYIKPQCRFFITLVLLAKIATY